MDIQDQPLQAAGETSQSPAGQLADSTDSTAPIPKAQTPGKNIAHTLTSPDPATADTPISTENSKQPGTSPESPTAATKIPTEEHQTASRSHKGLIIGVILAAIAVVSGLSLFIGFNNSSSQYQGFLQKIEAETEKLKNVPGDAPATSDLPGAPPAEAKDASLKGEAESAITSPGQSPAETNPDAALPAFSPASSSVDSSSIDDIGSFESKDESLNR